MANVCLDYGDGKMMVDLPDSATVVALRSNRHRSPEGRSVCGSAALLWTSAVIIVGPKNAGHVCGMGFATVTTYAEAFKRARKVLGGRNPQVLCTPECFTGGVAVHLYRK